VVHLLAGADEARQRLPDLLQGLSRAGIRLTQQRRAILRQVAAARNHPDAETLYREVRETAPNVSLDTVYRTLWLLRDLGLIDAIGAQWDRARFDPNTAPHHHFVCLQCGNILDFYGEYVDEARLPAALRVLGDAQSIHVEVRGICARCASSLGAEPNGGRKAKEERLRSS
jgi:Fur family transcriptional regulator, peroxide stress response regulator